MNEAQCRPLVLAAFRGKYGRSPNLTEAQCNQAISRLETFHARGWKGAGVGSFNHGADQISNALANVSNSFLYTDTHPNADGSSTPYSVHFRRYPDDVSGIAGMMAYSMRTQGERAAAAAGRVYDYSVEMYLARYYEGFGRTREARILNHHKVVTLAIRAQCAELGEALPDLSAPKLGLVGTEMGWPATLRRGSRGEPVKTWQRFLGIPATGVFDAACDEETRTFQRMYGITEDGLVGPQCWDRADGVLDGQYKAAA